MDTNGYVAFLILGIVLAPTDAALGLWVSCSVINSVPLMCDLRR